MFMYTRKCKHVYITFTLQYITSHYLTIHHSTYQYIQAYIGIHAYMHRYPFYLLTHLPTHLSTFVLSVQVIVVLSAMYDDPPPHPT